MEKVNTWVNNTLTKHQERLCLVCVPRNTQIPCQSCLKPKACPSNHPKLQKPTKITPNQTNHPKAAQSPLKLPNMDCPTPPRSQVRVTGDTKQPVSERRVVCVLGSGDSKMRGTQISGPGVGANQNQHTGHQRQFVVILGDVGPDWLSWPILPQSYCCVSTTGGGDTSLSKKKN